MILAQERRKGRKEEEAYVAASSVGNHYEVEKSAQFYKASSLARAIPDEN
jgi:hypothetical protein